MTRSRHRKLKRKNLVLAGVPLAATMLAAAPLVMAAEGGDAGTLEEIIVTATKRAENIQNVPASIVALGSEQLEDLHVQDFKDYVKLLPSVSMTTLGPGFSLAYFRGVASGENNNHSGPQPSVGMYLDEQPITTIQGALDVHLYDIARVESLAGPQGTLYGASSQAGTIRIITNKPDASGFAAAYAVEGNTVAHGGAGYVGEGFVNVPLGDRAAVRIVGWVRHDAGYIDNVPGTRAYPTPGTCISNSVPPASGCLASPAHAEKDYNDADTYGARAALRVELNDSWTITPSVMGQKQEANGSFAYDPAVGDLKLSHFYPEASSDKWVQAALTVEGRIANFDLVYAGSFLKRDDVVDADYSDYTFWYDDCCGYAAYWTDATGTPLADPSQFIHGTDGYKRWSHELRVTSPADRRVRFTGGLFYQDSQHEIFQNYQISGLTPDISVTGWSDTIWLTNQLRKDKDQAVFGELSFDVMEGLTATAGLRWFKTENSLRGFFGYNANYSGNYGEALCLDPAVYTRAPYNGSPCTNLDDKIDDSGNVKKFNLTYRFDDRRLVYATYSEGFRPGGINRNGTVPPYQPDIIENYELGWKTTWANGRLRFNGALFHEDWTNIQYSFLPPSGSGLTVIRNAGSARIDGIESDLTWAPVRDLILSGGISWLNARLSEDYVPDPTDAPAAFKGDRLPVTPKFKGNLTARYSFPLGGFDANVQAAIVYNGSSYSDLPREERAAFGLQPAYTVADLSAGIARGNYSVDLYANNAFDERGRTFTFANCTVSVCGSQPYYVPNQPRMIGLKFSQKF
jgi:outer membrane receptor protein involved in Fe transport